MQRAGFFVVLLAVLLGGSPRAAAAPIDELVAAAKKEGVLDMYAPSTLSPEGAQKLGEAFNRKYSLAIKLQYMNSGGMTRDVGKVVSLAAAGAPQEWDLMVLHDAAHATLWLRKLHKTFDYTKLGVDPKIIQFNSGTVAFANQFALPAYATKLVADQDVPGVGRIFSTLSGKEASWVCLQQLTTSLDWPRDLGARQGLPSL